MNIKLLSYNFFQRPIFIKNNKSDFKDERVDLFIKYFKNYDIICLQELFGSFNRRKVIFLQNAYKNGFEYIAHCDCPDLFNNYLIDGGLVIISKYPIIECEFKTFPFAVSVDGLSKKGILYAKILLNNKFVNIFNTHTQANYVTNNIDIKNKYMCCRYIQLFENCKYIKNKMKNFDKDELVIYLGDFNVNSLKIPDPLNTYDLIKDKLINYNSEIYYKSIKNNKILEYDLLFNTLNIFFGSKIIDIMKYENNKHLVTFGKTYVDKNNKEKPLEKILTKKNERNSNQCLDYIFVLNENGNSLKYKKNSLILEKFFEKNEKKFYPTQLSDHYGLSIIIN